MLNMNYPNTLLKKCNFCKEENYMSKMGEKDQKMIKCEEK